MLRLLLNALLALVAARFLFGLFRWMGDHPEDSQGPVRRGPGGPGSSGRSGGPGGPGGASGPARPGVDRSTVIDVPFTEEDPEPPAGPEKA